MTRPPPAFTVIELLVVISLIVVLIAMLSPALEKAVYQAKLAVDGANLKGIGAGALVYAVHYKRSYPDRFAARNASYMAVWLVAPPFDDRRKIMPFIDLKAMRDPFCVEVDFGMSANDSNTQVNANYDLYFGYRFFKGGTPLPGMFRIGDKLTWTTDSSQGPQTQQFGILATDHDRLSVGRWSISGHPDYGGEMVADVWQNRDNGAGQKWTLSRWGGVYERGVMDYQAAFDDGAVHRYLDVAYNAWQTDPRFTQVPNYTSGASFPTEYHNIPID